jgi:Ni/Co efflux regulator RcnB
MRQSATILPIARETCATPCAQFVPVAANGDRLKRRRRQKMKKFVLAAVAASMIASPVLVATPALAAPAKQTTTVVKHKPNGKVVVKQKTVKKAAPARYRTSWKRGERFDYRQARNYRQIDYRQFNRQYRGHLQAPPRGYRYVQSGNDVVLVGITSGIIAAVLANLIR